MRIALAWVDMSDPTDRAVAGNLAQELKALGHAVCLVGPKRRTGEPFLSSYKGFPLYRVGPREALAVGQLRRLHLREGIDLWHCHVFARSHRPFARAARSGGWPVLLTMHLILDDYAGFIGGSKGLRSLVAVADRVTVPARSMRDEFLRLCPAARGAVSIVHNGLPEIPDACAPIPGMPKRYILSVARLAPYKGLDLLLMAFAKLPGKGAAANLVLCGRDQLKGGLQRFIKSLGLEERVTLTGAVSSPRVQGLLNGCDLFVLPSRRENFPLAVLEAMAAGKALVATAVGGVPEMVRHGREGLLVPPNDVEALSRAMAELCGDRALSRRLGDSAAKRSRSFTWRAAAANYERIYGCIMARRRSSSGMRSKK